MAANQRKANSRSRKATAKQSGHVTRTTTRESAGNGLTKDLHKSVNRYRALLKALPDLMFVVKEDGTYVDFWAPAEEELAIPASEIIGQNLRDLGFAPGLLRSVFNRIKKALATGETQTIEYGLETQRGYGDYEARIVRLNPHEVLILVRTITDRKRAEVEIKQASQRLAIETRALHDKNVALEQVLQHLEQKRRDYQQQVCRELETAIRPVLTRLKENSAPAQRKEVEALGDELASILSRDIDVFRDRYATLTPRELELCDMLREGLSSKQISSRLNLSLTTVHKHRELIRKKLGFQGRRVNLSAYLRLHGDT